MERGEFVVNAIQDGVDEVVDGIIVGRCLYSRAFLRTCMRATPMLFMLHMRLARKL
jgi:hypothetical protein